VTQTLLKIADVTCAREGRTLFSRLNFEVAAGDCVELTGPNGSGKSTLLRCVTGLFADYEGAIEAAPSLYLGHKPGVSALLTPREQLRWYASLTAAVRDPLAVLEQVGLVGYEDVRCQHMSAGQQRRVALARLILCDKPLWLLDEPFTALDDSGQDLVRSLLTSHLASGGGAVCATHHTLGLAGTRSLLLGRAI